MSESITREELDSIIGERATDELLRAWGGTYFCFPKQLPTDHPLNFVVGPYNASQLSQHLSGQALDLPMFDDRNIARRNEIILERLSSGMTQKDVAVEFGLNVRTVRAIYTNHKRSNRNE